MVGADRAERAEHAERPRVERDRGLTLIELLVSMSLVGVIIATIAMSTITVMKTRASTTGRANNARSEQAIGLWMPGDLASAEVVDTSPGAVPCGPNFPCPAGVDLAGSNAVMLTWTSSSIVGGDAVTTTTVVSYRVAYVNGEYQMFRVLCTSIGGATATCEKKVVLHNLEAPPPGTDFVPGVTSPSWIITVSNALAADDTSGPDATIPPADPGLRNKNGQRVVVTINGGGTVAGAGGGQQQITLSAGGTNRETNLSTSDLSGAPTFTAARSRCGGNFAMLVDRSGSISDSQMSQVKAGIRAFINTFAGTPIKLEIVSFSNKATALGAGTGQWVRYFDMLDEGDVTELSNLVGTLDNNGRTNWEDGIFRLLKNADGTTQANLPNTIIFFTDGVPTISRLQESSATPLPQGDPLDGGIDPDGPDGSTFYQTGWNRAERLIRDRGGIDIIGVFVGSTSKTSQWKTAGAGYHWVYQHGSNVVFERGYHAQAEVGNAVTFERGYHAGYERNSNVTYQIAGSGVAYERRSGGSWVSARSGYSSTSSQARNEYLSKNTEPGEGDNYRLRVTGTPGGWVNISASDYAESNLSSSSSDGVRTTVGTLSSTWVEVTAAEYNASNTTSTSSDGWRTGNVASAPYSTWLPATRTEYLNGNTTPDSNDGWRASAAGTSTSWTSVSSAQYAASNLVDGEADGWRAQNAYSAPFDSWETSTYDAYVAGNTASGTSDGWRTSVSGSASSWITVSKDLYDKSNTSGGSSDGWQAVKSYSPPFDDWENQTSKTIKDYATLGNIVVDNTSGDEGVFVKAVVQNGKYTNAEAADLFVLPDYTMFAEALSSIALGQCGGTVTMQTRTGTSAALDPFTYQISSTNEIVQTSAAYRSGTFDVALPGGASQTVTISPQEFTNLVRYSPAGWSCKSAGQPYPFDVVPVEGHAPWTAIRLTVNPNQAVSCIQNVTFT